MIASGPRRDKRFSPFIPCSMAPTPGGRRAGTLSAGAGAGSLSGSNRAAVKSWAQIVVALTIVALPWCISQARGGAGKAAIERLSRDGVSFRSGRMSLRLSAQPGDGGTTVVGAGGGKGPPLRGGSGSAGGGGGVGSGEAASSMFRGKTWKGERLKFDAPDNVDLDKLIEFAPPPPPGSPKHALSYAQMKRIEDRIKLSETDPFERGLAVDAFKSRYAGFLPKPNHLPVHIPLPKDMSIAEVEEIQARLNAEGLAKGGKLHGADPAPSVIERMKRRQAADAQLEADRASKGGVHKSVVQLALERLSFSSKDAIALLEGEQELEQQAIASVASEKAAGGGGQDKAATGSGMTAANPRISLPRKPVFRSASLRSRTEDVEDWSDPEAMAKLFHAHGQGRRVDAAGRQGAATAAVNAAGFGARR